MKTRLIQRGKRGLWTVVVSLPGNQEKYIATGTADEDKARRVQRRVERQYEATQNIDNPRLADWLQHWYDVECAPRLVGTTLATYKRCIRQISEQIGQMRLWDLQTDDVRRMQDALLREGGRNGRPLAPVAVTQVRGILRTALRYAEAEGVIIRNVASLTRPPHVESTPSEHLSESDLHRLLDADPSSPWWVYAALVAVTGMRRGEALGLQWGDVDWDGQSLRVVRQLAPDVNGHTEERAPKTPAAKRSLPLSDDAIALLRALRGRQIEASAALAVESPVWVFAHRWRGEWRPYHYHQATRGVRRLYESAGLTVPRHPIHALRHTVATLMRSDGADARLRQEQLGHENPEITERVYTHVPDDERRQAVERLSRRVFVRENKSALAKSRAGTTDSQSPTSGGL